MTKINPALIAALDHYASGRFNPMEPTMCVHTDEHGHQSDWSLERVCGAVAEVLADENLNLLRVRALQDGLRSLRLEWAYEKIMGERLE